MTSPNEANLSRVIIIQQNLIGLCLLVDLYVFQGNGRNSITFFVQSFDGLVHLGEKQASTFFVH